MHDPGKHADNLELVILLNLNVFYNNYHRLKFDKLSLVQYSILILIDSEIRELYHAL